jgi:23S rRNA (pseudouridine1915-N3)-methyltransferase
MRLVILALGERMPHWVDAGFDEYAKRLPPDVPLQLVELKVERRAAGKTLAQLLDIEGERLLRAVPKDASLTALDERGEQWTTAALAQELRQRNESGRPLAFAIGSADGLAEKVKQRADRVLALSKFTLPHGLVRVLLAEQLYRAVSLLRNHPYHRD